MTSGSSMQAMIRTAPPHAEQVSMLIPNTRLRRNAQLIVARVIRASAMEGVKPMIDPIGCSLIAVRAGCPTPV